MPISAITDTGDWTFGRLISGVDEVTQNLKTRLLSFKSDWYLDLNANIDWFAILQQKNPHELLITEITRVALATPEVLSVADVNVEIVDGRRAIVEMRVNTTFGELEIELNNGI
jgi:hypothetical protein